MVQNRINNSYTNTLSHTDTGFSDICRRDLLNQFQELGLELRTMTGMSESCMIKTWLGYGKLSKLAKLHNMPDSKYFIGHVCDLPEDDHEYNRCGTSLREDLLRTEALSEEQAREVKDLWTMPLALRYNHRPSLRFFQREWDIRVHILIVYSSTCSCKPIKFGSLNFYHHNYTREIQYETISIYINNIIYIMQLQDLDILYHQCI